MVRKDIISKVLAIGLTVVTLATSVCPTVGVRAESSSTEASSTDEISLENGYCYINSDMEFTTKRYELRDNVAYPNNSIYTTYSSGHDSNGNDVQIGGGSPYGLHNKPSIIIQDTLYMRTILQGLIEIEDNKLCVYEDINLTGEKGGLLEVFTITKSEVVLTGTEEYDEDFIYNVFDKTLVLESTSGEVIEFHNDGIKYTYPKLTVSGSPNLWESRDIEGLNYFEFQEENVENGIATGSIELNLDGGYEKYLGTYTTDNATYINIEAKGYNENFEIINMYVYTEMYEEDEDEPFENKEEIYGNFLVYMDLKDSEGNIWQLRKCMSQNFAGSSSETWGIPSIRVKKAAEDIVYSNENDVHRAVEIKDGDKLKVTFDMWGYPDGYSKTFTEYENRKGKLEEFTISKYDLGFYTEAFGELAADYNLETTGISYKYTGGNNPMTDVIMGGCEIIISREGNVITLEEKIGDYITINSCLSPNNDTIEMPESMLLYFDSTGTAPIFIDNFLVTRIKEYTINYIDYDTQEVIHETVCEEGEATSEPKEPEKEGYKFLGWYSKDYNDKLSKYDFSSVIYDDLTLYARWEQIEYQVKFVDQNGKLLKTISVPYNGFVAKPEDNTIDGWYTDISLSKLWNCSNPITGDMTLYFMRKNNDVVVAVQPTTEPETESETEPTTEPETEPTTKTEESTPIPEPTTKPEEPTTPVPEETSVPKPIPVPIPEETTEEPTTPEPETTTPVIEPITEEPTTVPEEETTPFIEKETETTEEPTTKPEPTTEQSTYENEVEQVEMKSAMEVFKEVLKVMAIVFSIGLAGLLGILGILLLIMYWLRRVKVMNNVNTDEYQEDDYKVVYKTTTKTEGSRIAELFKKSDRVWNIVVPVKVMDELVSNEIRIVFNKHFCKRYNGEQLVVILQNNDTDSKEYGFVIDSEENEITFAIEK